ncbi:MAG TPA: NAD(+) diphosphatase [Anaerovoracaceae bacterium]|nr:NAD(+) diphosphatase [Anaerovoracaceae bacterium]
MEPDPLRKPEDGEGIFPALEELGPELAGYEEMEYLGTCGGSLHCFFLPWDPAIAVPEGMEFRSLKAMYPVLGEDIGLVASRAIHLAGWNRRNKYCGVCGRITRRDDTELARVCPACGNHIYPKISPAIIIAVIKEDKLLLAHNKNFRERWYSTLAGFIEPGESIEACAEREVYEEVGIKIKNIRYFASQPWPFPDSLMIGLIAEYESGEIRPDGVEIDDADFFSAAELPDTPGRHSVAGRMIEWFIGQYR